MSKRYLIKNSYIDIEGRKRIMGELTWCFLCILSFGILYSLSNHYINLKIFITTKKCNLAKVDCVIITNQFGRKTIVDIKEVRSGKRFSLRTFECNGMIRILDTEYARFLFDYSTNKFTPYRKDILKNFDFDTYYYNAIKKEENVEKIEIDEKLILYGRNISCVRLPSLLDIFLKNMFSISILVNVMCIVLWFMIEYKIYASIVALFVGYGFIEDIYSQIKYKMSIERCENIQKVSVVRRGKFVECDARDIFPGDIIYIEPCKEFCCDAIVVKGDVIADESFLTGESIPICKSSSKKEMVFSGTAILKSTNVDIKNDNLNLERLCRIKNLVEGDINKGGLLTQKDLAFKNYAIGIVKSTGFNTTRGQLMKNVLNTKPVSVPFLNEAIKTIQLLIAVSLILNTFLFFYLYKFKDYGLKDAFLYSMDLFFTLAAPTLPTSINVGIQLSVSNLKKAKIHCKNIDRIYLASKVDSVIFDKTGTLTCEGMNIYCVDNLEKTFTDSNSVDFITNLGLSTCHSVYELDGKFSGDTLDIEMLIFSNSKLKENAQNKRMIILGDHCELFGPFLKERGVEEEMYYYQDRKRPLVLDVSKNDSIDSQPFVIDMETNADSGRAELTPSNGDKKRKYTFEIIKTYDFDSNLRRMSVIVTNGDKKYLFCKGSPDSIESIINSKPKNYDNQIKDYSADGFRVITLAYRVLKIMQVKGILIIIFIRG